MSDTEAKILSHVPNSGIVQLPGPQFPGVAIQGDSLSNMFDQAAACVREFKRLRQEDACYEAFHLAEHLQEHLIHCEATSQQRGASLPSTVSIHNRLINHDYDTSRCS